MPTPALRSAPSGLLVLLAAIAILAVAWLLALTTLSNAFRTQKEIREALALSDQALLLQVDEETGMRGYKLSHDPTFLKPYRAAQPLLPKTLGRLGTVGAELDLPSKASIAEMGRIHQEWMASVALPALRATSVNEIRQLRGMALVDRYRASNALLRRELEARAFRADAGLRLALWRIAGGALVLILAAGSLLTFFSRRQRQLERALLQEHQIVDTLQAAFAQHFRPLPQTDIGTAYLSASADATIGGDLFDVRRLDATTGYVLVADISGKGVAAAVDTALIKYSINALAHHLRDTNEILRSFNRIWLESRTGEDAFVVLFLGVFDTQTLTLNYSSAGHPQAYLRREGRVEALPVTGPLVGFDETDGFGSRTLQLRASDLLVLTTDGLTEARARHAQKREMLTEEGLMRWVAEADDATAQSFVDEILRRLHRYAGTARRDDLALLAMKIVSSGPHTAARAKLAR